MRSGRKGCDEPFPAYPILTPLSVLYSWHGGLHLFHAQTLRVDTVSGICVHVCLLKLEVTVEHLPSLSPCFFETRSH